MNAAYTSTLPVGGVRVRDLRLGAGFRDEAVVLVDDVNLDVAPGEAIGLVGESGSGKSLTLRALLGMLPAGVQRVNGEVEVGGRAAMVFQDPLTALDPLETIGSQIAAAARVRIDAEGPQRGGGAGSATAGVANDRGHQGRYRWGVHRSWQAIAARKRALELMTAVHLPDPETRYGWYPHQLSGGQRQRVVIAIALATEPDVLLCDEPTTALDVTVQSHILALLDELRAQRGLTLVFVSHNLAVVAQLCTRIAVMKTGRVVESGRTGEVIARPQHAYTRTLLGAILSVPPLAESSGGNTLAPGRGSSSSHGAA